MGIFTLTNCNFDYIFEVLKPKVNVSINDMNADVILITNKEFIIKNLDLINKSLFRKSYFVFCSEEALKEFNIPFVILNEPIKRAELVTLIKKKSLQDQVVYTKINIAKKYLKRTKPSAIKDLSTVLYKIQNKDLRESYRTTIFRYLNSKTIDIEKLESSLILLSNKKSSTLTDLLDIVKSEIFSETHKEVINTKLGLAKKSKISSFDINYIISFKN